MATHNIHPSQSCILNADPLETVWLEFVEFVEGWLENGRKKGLFVAWNGSSCDMAEFFKVIEITHKGVLSLPHWCPYFCHPKYVLILLIGWSL